MDAIEDAIAALEGVGFTEYEARCFVALTRMSQGTAKEISQVADVPRSRVYDTIERLHDRGLVDVQQSTPRQFRAVSKDMALERLHREFTESVEVAESALEGVPDSETPEREGAWQITDHEPVADRMVALIEEADREAHLLISDDRAVDDRIIQRLADARGNGVTVHVEVPSEDLRDRLQRSLQDATVVVADDLRDPKEVVEKRPGQLLMVDQRAVLASGIEEELPDIPRETAVWTTGRDHGFAAWVHALIAHRIERDETDG